MGRSSSGRGFVHVSKSALLVSFVGLQWRFFVKHKCCGSEHIDAPIGSRGARCAAYGRLEDHAVCWLVGRKKDQQDCHEHDGRHDVQPMLAKVDDGVTGDNEGNEPAGKPYFQNCT